LEVSLYIKEERSQLQIFLVTQLSPLTTHTHPKIKMLFYTPMTPLKKNSALQALALKLNINKDSFVKDYTMQGK